MRGFIIVARSIRDQLPRVLLLCTLGSVIMMSGCGYMIQATPMGAKLRVMPKDEKHSCKFLGMVVGFHDFGNNVGEDLKSAINDARNKAAELGANAIRFTTLQNVATVGAYTSGASTATAEAFRCNTTESE